MKVLIITENLGRGGAERVLSYLSQQSQLDVEYVFLSLTPIVKYRFNSRIYVIGRGVLSINLPMLYRVLLHEKPDVVMGSTHLGRYMTILCLGRKKVTRLGIHPDAVLKGSLGPLNWLLHLLAIGISKRVITPSVEIKQALTNRWKIPPSKVVVIRNPVDVEKVSVMAEEPLDSRDSQLFSENLPVILSVGRLHRSKGHWHLIRIFKKVNQQIPESRLVLVGDGPFAMYLVGLASRLELQNKVFFLGWRPNPFKYMSRSRLFCLPSLFEDLPNVVLEALSCGLPVMSSDCISGPREILAPSSQRPKHLFKPEYGEYGILMPVFDGKMHGPDSPLTWQEEIWADEIVRVLNDESILRIYRDRGLKRARDFDVKRIARLYAEVFRGL